jgi:O-antigen/teichoic acid export membrane protein
VAGGIVATRLRMTQLRRDSLTYFVSKVIPGATGLLSVTVFVRLFGYDQYGHYAVSLALAVTLGGWASGWLAPGVLRYLTTCRTPDDIRRFGITIRQGLLASIAVGGLVTPVAFRILLNASWPVTAAATLIVAAMIVYVVNLATLQAALQATTVVKLEAARTLLAFLTPIALVTATGRKTYPLILAGVFVGYTLPLIVYRSTYAGLARPVNRLQQRNEATANGPELSAVWRYGWPVALWALANQGFGVVDRSLVQHYHGYAAAGLYASMYDVVIRSFSLIFFPITLATHPIVMRHWNAGERTEAMRIIKVSVTYQTVLCVPILLVLYLTRNWVGTLVTGASTAESAAIVIPLAVGGCLWQLALLIQKPLEVLCQTHRMLQAMAASFVFSVGANCLTVPTQGLVAAAYVNALAAVVYIAIIVALTPLRDMRRDTHQLSGIDCAAVSLSA